MANAIHTEARFNDEDAARDYLESIRWPSGPVCPHCGGTERNSRLNGAAHRPGLLFCGDCRTQFSVTVGTVFESSKVGLHKWVYAAHLMCASKKGISSKQLERMLGVSYKTAWFMSHRIREAMSSGGGLLGGNGGIVEADETYWGNCKQSKKFKAAPAKGGYGHKEKIVALVERGGKVRAFHVARVTSKTVREVLRANVCETAHLMTDEGAWYETPGKEQAAHSVVNHKKGEYSRGIASTNSAEGYFSLLKRGLIGTFHHVGPQHLQRYVREFDFRYNNRSALGIEDAERTENLLRGIGGKRLTYRRIEGQQSA
jgi:transposase-like protein